MLLKQLFYAHFEFDIGIFAKDSIYTYNGFW